MGKDTAGKDNSSLSEAESSSGSTSSSISTASSFASSSSPASPLSPQQQQQQQQQQGRHGGDASTSSSSSSSSSSSGTPVPPPFAPEAAQQHSIVVTNHAAAAVPESRNEHRLRRAGLVAVFLAALSVASAVFQFVSGNIASGGWQLAIGAVTAYSGIACRTAADDDDVRKARRALYWVYATVIVSVVALVFGLVTAFMDYADMDEVQAEQRSEGKDVEEDRTFLVELVASIIIFLFCIPCCTYYARVAKAFKDEKEAITQQSATFTLDPQSMHTYHAQHAENAA